jgi:hypothetical protein
MSTMPESAITGQAAAPKLLTEWQVIEAIGLHRPGRSEEATRKAFTRLWQRVQDRRHDRNKPPLKRVQYGRWFRYYETTPVEMLAEMETT